MGTTYSNSQFNAYNEVSINFRQWDSVNNNSIGVEYAVVDKKIGADVEYGKTTQYVSNPNNNTLVAFSVGSNVTHKNCNLRIKVKEGGNVRGYGELYQR